MSGQSPQNIAIDYVSEYSSPSNAESIESLSFSYQSDEVAMGTSETAPISEEKAATMAFLEKPGGYSAGFSADLPAASYADATPDVSLDSFLSRPVRIYTYTWNEADVVGSQLTINPWALFFNNANIKNKLVNYAWLKCDLKIKVLVNASPFYFGTTLMSYCPLPAFHTTSIVNDASTRFLVPHSQRPHVWIYPQNNEGGEMTLPFIWPKNWISTLINQDLIDLGSLTFTNAVALDSANGAAGTGVTVSLYAWAENVVLSGPTCGLLQQADEYGKGPISSVASAVATAARALTGIPVIKPFATATQMGAIAIGSVASSLGYCNTPVIEESRPVKPCPLPVLASTEQGYPVEKLTIDPKNELSIDPKIVGMPSEDELMIASLAQRESFIVSFPWASTVAADGLLFSTAVSPVMFAMDALASPKVYMTPLCWLTQMFQFWRGDIIFRFRFIASQYHRGRIRITYDPSGSAAQNVLNTVDTQTTCFNEIIDLTKDTNVEVRVPYNQALAWCQTFVPTSTTQIPYTVGSGTAFNHVPAITNGTLAVRCVTALTAPVAASTITCLVSVRGADNFEVAGPKEVYNRYSQFVTQSDEYDLTTSTQVLAGHAHGGSDPNRFLVNMGENVVTLRQLARRYMLVRVKNTIGTQPDSIFLDTFARMPPNYGFDTAGVDVANGLLVPGSNFAFNYVTNTYLNWIAMCFLGYRGSVNWTVNTSGAIPTKHLSVSRFGGAGTVANALGGSNATSSGIIGNFYLNTAALGNASGNGMSLTNQLTTACINTANPMYSAYKMNTTSPGNPTAPLGVDDTINQLLRLHLCWDATVTGNATQRIFYYAAAGTDWSVHFFLNVPTLWRYSGQPPPV